MNNHPLSSHNNTQNIRDGLGGFFKHVPIYVIVLAVYPIGALFAINISQVFLRDTVTPLLVSLAITPAIFLTLRVFSRNWLIAGLLTGLLLVWFFFYGHLYVLLRDYSIFGILLGRHRFILTGWSALITAAGFFLVKRPQNLPTLTLALNLISLLLICFPIIQITGFQIQNLKTPPRIEETPTSLISWTGDSPPPDIYYIVLDGYTRSDVLRQEFELDNTAFLNGLEELGFYVAACAQSNYTRTILSLSSTFNMDYIQNLKTDDVQEQKTSWLLPYLKNNLVRQQLESLGYKTIVFKHPWERFVWDDAAVIFKSSGSELVSHFEYLLLRTTAARLYLDLRLANQPQPADHINYVDTLFALKQLPTVPNISGPKFVFAHLIIPHAPFVFGPDGERIVVPYDADAGNIYKDEDYRRGYTAAVQYINKRMLEILPELLENSRTPPIIILAGDHGTPMGGAQQTVKILNAFYTPGVEALFYETASPVNTFRILFNSYFDGQLDILPDQSFYSAESNYFNFQEIPNTCGNAE